MTPQLKVKKLEADAELPSYESEGAAGLDLRALERVTIAPGRWERVRTGIALEIPPGYEGQVRPRSGLATQFGLTVLNAPGTIDSDYRGEVLIALINHGTWPVSLEKGSRVAQLIICPVTRVDVVAADRLSETPRGEGGFGSTGR